MLAFVDSLKSHIPACSILGDVSTMPAPEFNRVPSVELLSLLSSGGFLEPLVGLTNHLVSGSKLDVHLRTNDEVQVYCGLSRVLSVRRNKGGTVRASAHSAYSEQNCAMALMRRWYTNEEVAFKQALETYVHGVGVTRRHREREGAIQTAWSSVRDPWVPFDREAVLKYGAAGRHTYLKTFKQMERARKELIGIARSKKWAMLPSVGREVDQLAIDAEGRLVIAELKDAVVCSLKTEPVIMRVLWDDLNRLKGGSSHEEVPIQSGAGRLRPAPGGGGHAGC